MRDIEVSHPDHLKVYARWTVIIGGGKSPITWAMKPPTTRKSTAKLCHIGLAKVQGSFEPALSSGERLRVLNAMFLSSRPRVAPLNFYVKKVNVGIIVQLSRDHMDWVSQRLCFAFVDTDRSVS